MAQGDNKEINQLEQATEIQDADLFVLEQEGEAKKLLGSTLKSYAEEAGINAIREIYPRTPASNDPDNSVFDVEIPDAGEAPMHSTVIKGKTAAVNQLIVNGNFADGTTGWSMYNSSLGSISVSGGVLTHSITGGTTTAAYQYGIIQTLSTQKNTAHNYYFSMTVKPSVETTFAVEFGGAQRFVFSAVPAGTKVVLSGINTPYTGASSAILIYPFSAVSGVAAPAMTIEYSNVVLKDLTAEGYTAAETTDMATFKAAFLRKNGYPLPQYIPYDAGSLKNVDGEYQLTGKNLVYTILEGRNIGSSGVINSNASYKLAIAKVHGGDAYSRLTDDGYYAFFESEPSLGSVSYNGIREYSADNPIIAPITGYIAFRTSAAYTQPQLELGSTATAYEPYYNGGSIDLSSAPLNGFDDTVCDEKDFATGQRTTRCGMVDLGTLSFSNSTSAGVQIFKTGNNAVPNATASGNTTPNTICPIYSWHKNTNFDVGDKFIVINSNGAVIIRDSSLTDASQLSLSGVYLCYELATPTTSTETPQPLETQYGYNLLEPVSGGVQSAEVDTIFYENIAGYIDKRLNGG